jgi:hypothetical protein
MDVKVGHYRDGSAKLTVLDRYGRVDCEATVCLRDSGEKPRPGHVFVREWGESTGMLHALQNAGVIGRTERVLQMSAHTADPLSPRVVHECRLLNH